VNYLGIAGGIVKRATAFSAAAPFDISASTNSPFGSHQGIRSAVADCSDPMIRNFNISQMVAAGKD
jgi:hypothetical protein